MSWMISGVAFAAPTLTGTTGITIQGRADAVVTDNTIKLADVAQIDSPRIQDDESIIQLKQIVLGASPRAGERLSLDGTEVLARLRDEGVKLDAVRYTLPRQITVTRAFREVSMDELSMALSKFVEASGRQIEVRKLMVEKPVRIPTDSFGVEVVSLQSTNPGHFGADFRSVAGADQARFQLRLIADEWRLMPVASRPLKKGAIVSGQDVELNRINGTSVGRDSVENLSDIVGQSLTRDVGQGEMFRTTAVTVTPIIKAGQKVTLLFRQGRLEATASGTALENAASNQEIKVRNEGSRKVVVGRAVEPGIVAVGGQ
jgi:flagella basal body P-ring formation protein FlgA